MDALAYITKEPVSLAILDVMMPGMDGFTLCQKIRQKHLFPIIMLTARISDIDKIQGLTLGADDYIVKPFNPLEVVARVKTQLRRYKQYNADPANLSAEPTEYDAAFISWKPLLRAIMFPVFFSLLVAGCYYIAYRSLLKPLEYLDDVAEAAGLLASPTDAPVSLPVDLKSIEDDLNAVRIQTLESQRAAREAEQRRDDLLVYLAHGLKTPLTSVLGYLKLL